jgi:hypothetical protein
VTVGEVATVMGPRLRLERITERWSVRDYLVIHTMTGKELGEVVQTLSGWTFLCPQQDCLEDCYNASPTPEAAAVALNAHDLRHQLDRIAAKLMAGALAREWWLRS